MSETKISSFGKAFISYGSYHFDTVNKWIHIVCIPIITATLVCALSYVPLAITIHDFKIGPAEILVAMALIYYTSMNIFFGAAMLVIFSGIIWLWKHTFANVDEDYLFVRVISVLIGGFFCLFIGHGFFEKRKPGLFDNMTQFMNGPMFTVIQLYQMLGFSSPQMKQWHVQIVKNVEEYRESKKQRCS